MNIGVNGSSLTKGIIIPVVQADSQTSRVRQKMIDVWARQGGAQSEWKWATAAVYVEKANPNQQL